MNIVQNIEKIAKAQGLTLTEIERRCGFSKSSIRKWSENIPNVQKVISVSEILNVSVDYLLGTDIRREFDNVAQQLLDEVRSLSDDDLKKVIEYAELLKLKSNDKSKNC